MFVDDPERAITIKEVLQGVRARSEALTEYKNPNWIRLAFVTAERGGLTTRREWIPLLGPYCPA